MTIERLGTRLVSCESHPEPVNTTLHRHVYGDGECYRNYFLLKRPAGARRGWLSAVLGIIAPYADGGPGQWFAGTPVICRRRRGRLLVSQRCGWDV